MRMILAVVALTVATATAGAADDATHSFASDGKTVQLVVEVRAEHVAADDHVELWLATVPTPSDYVRSATGALYLIDGHADASALATELAAPAIAAESERCDDHAVGSAELADLRRSLFGAAPLPLQPAQAWFGMVHLGLFADGRGAVLYDRARYADLGRDGAGHDSIELDAIDRGVTYAVKRTATGYRITATLAPIAFGFMPREGLHAFAGRVEVHAGDRAPGPAAAFDTVKLARPIAVELVPGVPVLGDGWPAVFVHTATGWVPVEHRVEQVAVDVGRCTYVASRVTRVAFARVWTELVKTERAGSATVRVFNLSDTRDDHVLVTAGAAAARIDRYGSSFVFADGVPGVLAASVHTQGNPEGYCGAGDIMTFTMIRLAPAKVETTELARIDGCRNQSTVGGVAVAEPSDGSLDGAPDDVMTFIHWRTRGRVLAFTLPVAVAEQPRSHVWELSWDAHGGALRVRDRGLH